MNYLENYLCNFDVEEMYGYTHVLCSLKFGIIIDFEFEEVN